MAEESPQDLATVLKRANVVRVVGVLYMGSKLSLQLIYKQCVGAVY